MKKTFLLMLVLIFALCFGGVPVYADTIVDITFDSGTMFSVGLGNNETFDYTVKGLVSDGQGGYNKVTIPDPQNISWGTSDDDIVDFTDSSGDTATILSSSVEEGDVVITATYGEFSVHSNVFVTSGASNAVVEDIYFELDGVDSYDFGPVLLDEVNNFSLKDIYGTGYNDSGIKKDEVTATHVLLYALEEQLDAEGVADGWDWVAANVVIGYNGAFIESIEDDVNYGMTGWMYKMKEGETWVLPMVSASQYVIEDDDEEIWKFATWGEW